MREIPKGEKKMLTKMISGETDCFLMLKKSVIEYFMDIMNQIRGTLTLIGHLLLVSEFSSKTCFQQYLLTLIHQHVGGNAGEYKNVDHLIKRATFVREFLEISLAFKGEQHEHNFAYTTTGLI